MKKIALIICLILLTTNPTLADKEKQGFINPLFYQQLIDTYDDTFYILTPTSKFFEIPMPIVDENSGYTEVKCTLLVNEENFIKMLCNDCTDINCPEHQERINTFEILPYDEKTDRYYIKHQIFDKTNETKLRENLLQSDGLITIAPYQ